MVDLVLAGINLIIEDFFILEIFIFSRLDDAHGPARRLIRYPAHKAREATLGHRCCPVGHGSIRLRHLLVQLMILAYVDLILGKLRQVGVDGLRRWLVWIHLPTEALVIWLAISMPTHLVQVAIFAIIPLILRCLRLILRARRYLVDQMGCVTLIRILLLIEFMIILLLTFCYIFLLILVVVLLQWNTSSLTFLWSREYVFSLRLLHLLAFDVISGLLGNIFEWKLLSIIILIKYLPIPWSLWSSWGFKVAQTEAHQLLIARDVRDDVVLPPVPEAREYIKGCFRFIVLHVLFVLGDSRWPTDVVSLLFVFTKFTTWSTCMSSI